MITNADIVKELAKEKPVAIFGAGVSGLSAQKLLEKIGLRTVIYAENLGLKFGKIEAQNHSLVVYSPAFRPDHEWIKIAESSAIECICESDLSALLWSGKIIAITGTNGKTTLTNFITHALNKSGIEAIAVGNIGVPLSEVCAQKQYNKDCYAICELSSFQTSKLKYLKPDALIWTNFDSDHLDWHRDLLEYFSAKLNLVRALKSDIFVAGSAVKEYAEKFGITLPNYTKIFDEFNVPTAPEPFASKIQSKNFEAAKILWNLLGLNENNLIEACKTFALPKFRFSQPATVDNVRFFNDSKATNAHAAIAAINELANSKKLIWLGGGKDKLCDLSPLVECVAKNCASAVLIGQTAEKLRLLLAEKNVPTYIAKTMNEAVEKCFELAGSDADVVFSPAFSSFGMFAGYAERGKSFDNAVLCLKNLKKM